MLASFSSRSAARMLRASWNAWYGNCSNAMLPVERIATRRRRDPTGIWPVRMSCSSNSGSTVSGLRSRGSDGLAAASVGRAALVVKGRMTHCVCNWRASGLATALHLDMAVVGCDVMCGRDDYAIRRGKGFFFFELSLPGLERVSTLIWGTEQQRRNVLADWIFQIHRR